MKQSANNTIEQHRAVTAKIKKDYPRLQVVDDMNPSVGAPAPSTSTPTPGNPNVMPWDEYLKKHGLKK